MIYDIRDFGAISGGDAINTTAIQSAILEASKTAGQVLISGGVYKTGAIRLLSNVELKIDADAVLLGSEDYADFPEWETTHVDSEMLPRWRNACLIFAENAENISITGLGKIDCNGHFYVQKKDNEKQLWHYERIPDKLSPPRVVFFTGCKNIHIKDITIVNQPAGWSYWIHDCDYVHIFGINILAPVNYPNNDGIHINSSRDVTISNCNITTGDDSIVVRANNVSLKENKVCERITVTNCNLTSHTAGIRISWVNDGVIRNCTFSNLTMTDCITGISIWWPKQSRESGFSDVGREFSVVENLSFSNIVMDRIAWEPIYIHMENETPQIKAVKNLHFSGLRSRGGRLPYISGAKICPVENIKFSDCSFTATNDTDARIQNCYLDSYTDYFPMTMHWVKNLQMTGTDFTVEK